MAPSPSFFCTIARRFSGSSLVNATSAAAGRMGEAEVGRVQELPASRFQGFDQRERLVDSVGMRTQACFLLLPAGAVGAAVDTIAHQRRVTVGREMHADLVSAAREEFGFEERERAGKAGERLEAGRAERPSGESAIRFSFLGIARDRLRSMCPRAAARPSRGRCRAGRGCAFGIAARARGGRRRFWSQAGCRRVLPGRCVVHDPRPQLPADPADRWRGRGSGGGGRSRGCPPNDRPPGAPRGPRASRSRRDPASRKMHAEGNFFGR